MATEQENQNPWAMPMQALREKAFAEPAPQEPPHPPELVRMREHLQAFKARHSEFTPTEANIRELASHLRVPAIHANLNDWEQAHALMEYNRRFGRKDNQPTHAIRNGAPPHSISGEQTPQMTTSQFGATNNDNDGDDGQ